MLKNKQNLLDFENKIAFGLGIYSTTEIANILGIPYHRAHTWIDKYWDGELGREYEKKYSWRIDKYKAVSFHTLVEFSVMINLATAGVKTRQVLIAHKELSKIYKTAFPFAHKEVLKNIKIDGKKIFLKTKEGIISMDGSKQFNLDFINIFFKKLDFDKDNLATRLWPLGKDKSILIDPERKFGHPVLNDKNIYPETIYNHYKAGDPIEYIAHVYDISNKQIKDALQYAKAA